MAVSKKRKKKGKAVKHSAVRRAQRLENAPSGVSLQDLINVLAYQEYVADGTIVPETSADAELTEVIDFEDPKTQAVIKAVGEASKNKGDVISEGKPPVFSAIDKIAEQQKENQDER